jgi:hypothetical protein
MKAFASSRVMDRLLPEPARTNEVVSLNTALCAQTERLKPQIMIKKGILTIRLFFIHLRQFLLIFDRLKLKYDGQTALSTAMFNAGIEILGQFEFG